MAEETAPQNQQVQLIVDDRDIKTLYANAYRIHTAIEEVVVDLGFNMPNPNTQPGQPQAILFKVSDRLILSFPNAKRLALSLGQLVKRYEQQFGELPLVPPGARQSNG
jgi:hypothetical protein